MSRRPVRAHACRSPDCRLHGKLGNGNIVGQHARICSLSWAAWDRPPRRPARGAARSASPRDRWLELTRNVYTDPSLLDVAGAMEALPRLSLSGEAQADAKQAAQ